MRILIYGNRLNKKPSYPQYSIKRLPRQKDVCGISRTHRGHRNEETLEYKKARSYCFLNGFFEPEKRETIFLGEPEAVVNYVKIALGNNIDETEIPDAPRGLVLSDNHGTGAFQ